MLWRHWKGGLYWFVGHAKHENTLETLVIYRDQKWQLWARPPKDFYAIVDGRPRFERLLENKASQ